MTIIVQVKTVYGVQKIYPICEKAQTFARMLEQTTLTPADLKHIKALGFTITEQQPTHNLF